MEKDKTDRFEITEMFMGQASADRCFYGCIKRLKDVEGNPFVFSRLAMPDGLLCASAPEQLELGENLDKLCKMICDEELHLNAGVSTEIFGTDFFLS
jgi:hypothetical protein